MWCSGGQSEAAALSQRTYRVALVLLSGGALFNCVGTAQPLRYVGAACVCAGALLVCAALARWLVAAAAHTNAVSLFNFLFLISTDIMEILIAFLLQPIMFNSCHATNSFFLPCNLFG